MPADTVGKVRRSELLTRSYRNVVLELQLTIVLADHYLQGSLPQILPSIAQLRQSLPSPTPQPAALACGTAKQRMHGLRRMTIGELGNCIIAAIPATRRQTSFIFTKADNKIGRSRLGSRQGPLH